MFTQLGKHMLLLRNLSSKLPNFFTGSKFDYFATKQRHLEQSKMDQAKYVDGSLKKFEIWSASKAVFHKFHLVHSANTLSSVEPTMLSVHKMVKHTLKILPQNL